ncbi:MAG: hypothetical protein HYU97_03930 [Deltaproteobacteria bacterium]|nr:hypothetical protein [Deltaproteobacteria bacterium]
MAGPAAVTINPHIISIETDKSLTKVEIEIERGVVINSTSRGGQLDLANATTTICGSRNTQLTLTPEGKKSIQASYKQARDFLASLGSFTCESLGSWRCDFQTSELRVRVEVLPFTPGVEGHRKDEDIICGAKFYMEPIDTKSVATSRLPGVIEVKSCELLRAPLLQQSLLKAREQCRPEPTIVE